MRFHPRTAGEFHTCAQCGDGVLDDEERQRIWIRKTTLFLMENVFTISAKSPFKDRDQRAQRALLAARLVDLMDFEQVEIVTPTFVEANLIDVPDPAPPPLVCARTSTAPPLQPAASCRVKELLTI
jgi:hypothetical protein